MPHAQAKMVREALVGMGARIPGLFILFFFLPGPVAVRDRGNPPRGNYLSSGTLSMSSHKWPVVTHWLGEGNATSETGQENQNRFLEGYSVYETTLDSLHLDYRTGVPSLLFVPSQRSDHYILRYNGGLCLEGAVQAG